MYNDEWWQMVEEVTCADVQSFFDTLPNKGCCPICKSELIAFKGIKRKHGHIIEVTEKPAIASKMIHESEPPFERIELPTLTSACDTCGFLADFSLHALLEWKARNGN